MIQLVAEAVDSVGRKSERLTLPNGGLLIYRYKLGDYDFIPWPLDEPKWRYRLAVALFGEIECGEIPDERTVLLPDGTTFDIDAEASQPAPAEGE